LKTNILQAKNIKDGKKQNKHELKNKIKKQTNINIALDGCKSKNRRTDILLSSYDTFRIHYEV